MNTHSRQRFLLAGVIALSIGGYFAFHAQQFFQVQAASTRGLIGDKWADIELGKRDFGEISAGLIVANKVNEPGGVAIDTRTSPGKAYVWDSGNSRILGIDLAKCYASSGLCTADLVIGQPAAQDYGACNGDASFDNYPTRKPATAKTLCGMRENTHTVLEEKTQSSMWVDSSGNLYVADVVNHRVLRYLKPFETDTKADSVWGQADFTGNGCNRTGNIGAGFYGSLTSAPKPTDSSLCFLTIDGQGSSVTLDASGNMWVADGGNNRVLRFPKGSGSNPPAAKADLVLGQANFTSGGDFSGGTAQNRMHMPTGVRFDASGALYVSDSANERVLVFRAPFRNGMNATSIIKNESTTGLQNIEIKPGTNDLMTMTTHDANIALYMKKANLAATKVFDEWGFAMGSLGFDGQGNVLYGSYLSNTVQALNLQANGQYTVKKNFFAPPYGYNTTANHRFGAPGWAGVAVSKQQIIAAVGPLHFWNRTGVLQNGASPSGTVSSVAQSTGVAIDATDNVYVSNIDPYQSTISVFKAPLTATSAAFLSLPNTLNTADGQTLTWTDPWGIAVTANSDYLWVTERANHRAFRIANPLTNPVVDIVLGQSNSTDKACNRDQIPEPNTGTQLRADRTMLCYPSGIAIDQKNNLYVSDHSIESAGNWRMLMYDPAITQASVSAGTTVYAPAAVKEFPAGTDRTHMYFQPAFNSKNVMVVGNNPYSGKRFLDFYKDPTKINPANASDPQFALPDGTMKDFYGWPVAASFDELNNLYVLDANRGQLRIYYNPFPL